MITEDKSHVAVWIITELAHIINDCEVGKAMFYLHVCPSMACRTPAFHHGGACLSLKRGRAIPSGEGSIPVSGLLAKCLLARLRSLSTRVASCILMSRPDGLDIWSRRGLGTHPTGQQCVFVYVL